MAMIQLSDSEIEQLISARKVLPANYQRLLKFRTKPSSEQHEEAQLELDYNNEGIFRVMIRKNLINPLDFSVILAYMPKDRLNILRLRRYNGVHEHSNTLEGIRFRGFHIHYATQRYQEAGWDIDKYAEISDKYSTADEALEIFFKDLNFIKPDEEIRPKLL